MEKKTTSFQHGLKFGVIIAVVLIVFTLVTFAFLEISTSAKIAWISYLVFIGLIIYGIIVYRNKEMGGFITYGQSFQSGFFISLASGFILTVFLYVYYKLIDPEAFQQLMEYSSEVSREKILQSMPNADESQIDAGIEMQKKFMTPGIVSFISFFYYLAAGVITSLIASVFIKKEDKLGMTQL